MVHLFSKENNILNNYIAQLRDVEVQKDSFRFRNNLLRIGMHMGFEISKKLNYESQDIQTPLGIATMDICTDKVVLGTILRAGLPLHDGLLQTFDNAENAIISAYRKHDSELKFHIEVEYMSSPSLENKVLVLCDPMLATGGSAAEAVRILKTDGARDIHLVSLLATEVAIRRVHREHPDVRVVTASVDRVLN